ncbi:fasciclin domain-containing protein [Nocardioides marmotae]|uniref:Fasciclin domain-containing protein n=1 Tax=Nocardioides marmotae TaxID=2663857 RepID=A0A6I3JF52_9ACTN|nr:fasciclin domain-containing protein [Nocardioides marmotae]MCR6033085.1 fasciclin domain-containing protein [Gordonia jinghuaiqii]MBC9732585.1 fasciclin domain-containing protein [Nocardioides marmotae]MTB83704.1 fasciclin domain-containing protein [Nocardioides marmotae]MTB96737.1 fasciclin domain-containing protein [Nocardioides marmotae]QKE03053.1 fasciclin domain-containing protein [Nocardioides marmotae]
MKHRIATAAVTALAASTVLAGAVAPAQAAEPAEPAAKAGNKSLAAVLGADGTKLDKNWSDFDLTEAAVLAVLGAKPDSPVGLLTQGNKRATAFVPTDRAFQLLVQDLKGFAPKTEAKTLKQVAKLGVDTIETVLLYHVVAGKTLTSDKVLAAEGQKVATAQGGSIKVHVIKGKVTLLDADKDDRNPRVVVLDINKGNKQVAHAIDRVLRPVDL